MNVIPVNSFEREFQEWEPHFETYRQLLMKNNKKTRRSQVVFAVEKFWHWLGCQRILPQALCPYNFVAYAQTLNSGDLCEEVEAYSPSTVAIYLGAAKAWTHHLQRTDLLLRDPFVEFDCGHPKKSLYQRSLSKKQVRKILSLPNLSTPWGLRDKAILEVLYGSGLRIGEATALTLESLDLDQRLLHLRNTKNGWDRSVPITRAAASSIEAYLREGRQHMQGSRTGTGLWLTYHHNVLTRDALVNFAHRQSTTLNFKFTMHSLRHACATHLLEGGANIRHIAELLGHSSLASTSHYAKARVRELQKVHARTHPRT